MKILEDEPEYWTRGLDETIIDEDTFNLVQESHFEKRIKHKLCIAADQDFYLRKFLTYPKCGGV